MPDESPLLVLAERALRVIVPDAYRRFPPLWTVEEQEACFTVRDRGGQALAYVYFEDEPGRRAAAKLLSHDEARSITVRSDWHHHEARSRYFTRGIYRGSSTTQSIAFRDRLLYEAEV